MADFLELLAQMREPGETGLPEDFADQLQNAYDETVSAYTETGATLSEQLAAANTAKSTAQAHNARLLRSLPVVPDPVTQQPGGNENPGGDDPFPKPVTLADLITYK